MHASSRWAIALATALPFAAAVPASAEKITLGSDLSAPASVVDAQGADTAFWQAAVNGAGVEVPVDGQVVSIKVKGTALREANAKNDPATMVHFQTLNPAGANGARQINLSSSPFYMPVDQPAAVSTFAPENLCVKQGGTVAFNTIGGFKWGGSLEAPTIDSQYNRGTPWQIFAAASASKVAWYSKDNGTKNGMTVTPAGGANASEGYGKVEDGRELLMQVVVATGDDRTFECGGPRRDGNGNAMKDMTVNADQNAYVGRDGSFKVYGYCGSARGDCTGGTMTITVGGRQISSGGFSALMQKDIVVAHKMSQADYVALANAPGATQGAAVTLTNALGTFTGTINLRTVAGGTLGLKTQKPYVANDRKLKPYAICSLPAGCTGKATLTAKGKTIAKAAFKTSKSGAILLNMRLAPKAFKALKRAKTMRATLTVISTAGTKSVPVTLRK